MAQAFFGGVHPNDMKAATNEKAIEQLAPPAEVVIPMSMHFGAPCTPLVKAGDQVKVGQKIGEIAGLGAPIHASVSGVVKAVDGISFSLDEGQVLGIVGESGSGKSVSSFSILKLIEPPGVVESDGILFQGEDISKKSEREMMKIRGKAISMVFQDPMTSLNPLYTIEKQITEMLDLHQKQMTKREKHARCVELLHMVGIPNPEDRLKSYPHQFSGGMRQRVIIAIALAANPKLIIADEPTTALDVTIQAQILKLMDKLVKEQDASLILITHDLAVVSQMADRIIVMYCGKIVESGSRDDVIRRPSHPYTEGLLNSIPRMGEEQKRLESIPGMVPSMLDLPQGCYFAPRCKYCQDICRTVAPESHEVGPGHCAACHFPLTGGESHE